MQVTQTYIMSLFGWGGRIRTYGTRYQKPMPYHLATPQRVGLITLTSGRVQDPILKKERIDVSAGSVAQLVRLYAPERAFWGPSTVACDRQAAPVSCAIVQTRHHALPVGLSQGPPDRGG